MELIDEIEKLKVSDVAGVISERMKSFGDVDDLFSELCFCLMTAGFRADKCVEIQDEIGDFDLSLDELKSELKRMGHRFWPQRAERIFLARSVRGELDRVRREGDRDWLVANVKGLGMKESSHFLRNVGFGDVAIVDFHIVDLLVREGLIEKGPLSKKRYLEIESVLRDLGKKVGLSLGELDLYLWFIETGKVLK
jgi:N-glycosylase/DNA lyase